MPRLERIGEGRRLILLPKLVRKLDSLLNLLENFIGFRMTVFVRVQLLS